MFEERSLQAENFRRLEVHAEEVHDQEMDALRQELAQAKISHQNQLENAMRDAEVVAENQETRAFELGLAEASGQPSSALHSVAGSARMTDQSILWPHASPAAVLGTTLAGNNFLPTHFWKSLQWVCRSAGLYVRSKNATRPCAQRILG